MSKKEVNDHSRDDMPNNGMFITQEDVLKRIRNDLRILEFIEGYSSSMGGYIELARKSLEIYEKNLFKRYKTLTPIQIKHMSFPFVKEEMTFREKKEEELIQIVEDNNK